MHGIKSADNKINSTNAYNDNNVGPDETRVNQILITLRNILSDKYFIASPKMSALLSYVVNEIVTGNSDRIKGYSVAIDALGKPSSFDPQNDPSVRVLANRLRASLQNYNAMNPEQALFIKMYRVSYVPHFIDRSGDKVQYDIDDEQPNPSAFQKPTLTAVSFNTQHSQPRSYLLELI